MSIDRALAKAFDNAKSTNQNPNTHAQQNPESSSTQSQRNPSPPKQLRRNSTTTTNTQNKQPQPLTKSESFSTSTPPVQTPENDDPNMVSNYSEKSTLAENDPGVAGVNLKDEEWTNLIKGINAMQNNEVQLVPLDPKIKKILNLLNLPHTVERFISLCQHYVTHAHPLFGAHDANAKFLIKLCSDLAAQDSVKYSQNDLQRNFYYFLLIHTFYQYLTEQKSQSFSKLLDENLFNATYGGKTLYLFSKKIDTSNERKLPDDFIAHSNTLLELFKKKNDSERNLFWNQFTNSLNLNFLNQKVYTIEKIEEKIKELENEKEKKAESTSSEGKDEAAENANPASDATNSNTQHSPPASASSSPKVSVLDFSTFNTVKADLENEKGDKEEENIEKNSSPRHSPRNG